MAVTTETTRPRAFDPSMASGAPARVAPPSWDVGPERRIDDGRTQARGLGWFSIGLGILELAATERLCESLGMEEYEDLVRLFGLREIATGIGILSSQQDPTNWIRGRVAGDVLDLALLATALSDNRRRGRVLGAIGAVAGATALDVLCHRQLTADHSGGSHAHPSRPVEAR